MNVGCEKRCIGHGEEKCLIAEDELYCKEYPCGCICYDRTIGIEVDPVVLTSLTGINFEPGAYYRNIKTEKRIPKKNKSW